ncbi:MAG TPA: TetR/AcrR family transcriptional regulator [Pseudonocardia sp.]|nr:TetR/AcrR family transcriptional regulator [Pseudonocardia sp.]
MAARDSYHHGDLRAALVDAGLALIAESGVEALSVAEAARRTGVSPAAPYRHFPTRQAFLLAVAIRAAELLNADLRAALAVVDDPCEALAVIASVYVRFVVRHRAGLDLVFAEQLQPLRDPDLGAAGRAVMDIVLSSALGVVGDDPEAALALFGKSLAAAHGFATLHLSGFGRRRVDIDQLASGAAEVSRTLAAAARTAATGHG